MTGIVSHFLFFVLFLTYLAKKKLKKTGLDVEW